MKAIYQSKQAFLHLSKGEVNRCMPVMGQAFVEGNYVETGKQAGNMITGMSMEFYCFRYGEDHNQITLTDPTEIENMRVYIKRRNDVEPLIREISFEE